jgi:predicted amidophosphoribosyltransferase
MSRIYGSYPHEDSLSEGDGFTSIKELLVRPARHARLWQAGFKHSRLITRHWIPAGDYMPSFQNYAAV